MIQAVFLVYSTFLVISVLSNPIPQALPIQQSPTWQPNLYNNQNSVPAFYQQPTRQTNSYSQPVSIQSQTPNQSNVGGTLNQQLISKIFDNPCIQKILDPNTKLYSQNGQEIQRHPNTGTGSNVINNYFIVPPEFFNLINNTTKDKPQNAVKRKTNNTGRKANQIKSKTKDNVVEDTNDSTAVVTEKEWNDQIHTKRSRNGQKKQKNSHAADKITEPFQINKVGKTNLEQDVKKVKKKRKQGVSSTTIKVEAVSEEKTAKSEEKPREKETICDEYQSIHQTRSKKLRTKPKVKPSKIYTDCRDTDTYSPSVVSGENKKNKDIADVGKTLHLGFDEDKLISQLKNIESPVDNREASKDLTENRQTRDSKNTKTKKEEKSAQRFPPTLDDVYRHLFPYMYFGNSFYPNGNYPFNFEQFYQPYSGKNNVKIKKRKNRKKQNEENNIKSISNIVEVPIKLKSNKKEVNSSTTINPISIESTEETQTQLDSYSFEFTSESAKPITDISTEIPNKITPEQSSEEEFEPKDFVTKKANLEMPPTMIEDLQDYIIPELERKDIVPTVQTHGIINDYYPIFNDDSYYSNDGNYVLKDLEDDRHFYVTDQGHQNLLNRDRRKYDRNEDYRVSNLDIRDRINFRRGYRYRKADIRKNYDDTASSIQKPNTHAKIIEQKSFLPDIKSNEVEFHSPPLLENPDFRTKRIEIESSKPSKDNEEVLDPVYTGKSSEIISENSDTKSAELGRVVNSDDTGIRKERIPSKNVRPKNDHIETVFAKTRVVKYGLAKDQSEENISVSMPTYEEGNESKFYSDGHTTFVLAKSLGHVDDYYW